MFAPERWSVSKIKEALADQSGKRAERTRNGAKEFSRKARTPPDRTN